MWRSTLWRKKWDGEWDATVSCDSSKSPDLLHTALDLRWLSANWWDSRKVLRPGRWRLPPSSRKSSHVKMQPPLLLSCFLRQGFHWNMVKVWQDMLDQGFRGFGLAQTLYMSIYKLRPDADLQSPISWDLSWDSMTPLWNLPPQASVLLPQWSIQKVNGNLLASA